MKNSAVAAVLFAVVLGAAAPATAGATNPHNVGSCTGCHLEAPRFGVDTRKTITFKTSVDDPGLCTSCHDPGQALHPVLVPAGSGPIGAYRSSFLPAGSSPAFDGKIVCISCHDIHAADGKFGLLRGFPGSGSTRYFESWQMFCDDCHGGNLKKRSPHTGGEKSCGFCHPAKPKKGEATEVVTRGRELCILCHDRIGENHYAQMNPFDTRKQCDECHDPHAKPADRPQLLSDAYIAAARDSAIVRPHYSRALCFACHENLDDYALRAEGVNETCNRCHNSGKIPGNIHPLRKVPASITPPKGWPLTDGALTCLTCHEQGHEDQERRPRMLRGGPYESSRAVCRSCHDPAKFQVSDIHKDINDGLRCDFCHIGTPDTAPGTGVKPTFIVDPNLPCLSCHEDPHPSLARHYLSVNLTAGVQVPPELPLLNGERMMCSTCHNPHIKEITGSKLRGWAPGNIFCTRCHLV